MRRVPIWLLTSTRKVCQTCTRGFWCHTIQEPREQTPLRRRQQSRQPNHPCCSLKTHLYIRLTTHYNTLEGHWGIFQVSFGCIQRCVAKGALNKELSTSSNILKGHWCPFLSYHCVLERIKRLAVALICQLIQGFNNGIDCKQEVHVSGNLAPTLTPAYHVQLETAQGTMLWKKWGTVSLIMIVKLAPFHLPWGSIRKLPDYIPLRVCKSYQNDRTLSKIWTRYWVCELFKSSWMDWNFQPRRQFFYLHMVIQEEWKRRSVEPENVVVRRPGW